MSFSKKKHVIIDLEALGGIHESDTIITALSGIVVQGSSEESYSDILARTKFWKLRISDQEYTRTSNPETVAWWEEQAPEVKIQCYIPDLERDMHPRDVLLQLNQYILDMGVNDGSLVWTRGTAYDIPKLLSLYTKYGIKPAFNSWNVCDSKTAFMVRSNGTTTQYGLGGNPVGFQKHNALHDTALETFKLLKYFKEVEAGAAIKPKGGEAKGGVGKPAAAQKQDSISLEGEDFLKFREAVLKRLAEGHAYTKDLTEMWNEGLPVKVKSLHIRNSLYKMRDAGLIKSVKSGLYSHWELMNW